jgi:hypothetical protein
MKNLKWSVLFVFSSLLILGACGEKNKSGQSGTESYWGGLNTGTYNGPAPLNTSNPYVAGIFQNLPCSAGGINAGSQRMGSGQLINMGVAFNSTYIGISTEGDIALVTSDQSGKAVLSLYLCPRPNLQSASASGLVINRSAVGCRIDEITHLSVMSPGMPLINFFPADYNAQLRQVMQCSGF